MSQTTGMSPGEGDVVSWLLILTVLCLYRIHNDEPGGDEYGTGAISGGGGDVQQVNGKGNGSKRDTATGVTEEEKKKISFLSQ